MRRKSERVRTKSKKTQWPDKQRGDNERATKTKVGVADPRQKSLSLSIPPQPRQPPSPSKPGRKLRVEHRRGFGMRLVIEASFRRPFSLFFWIVSLFPSRFILCLHLVPPAKKSIVFWLVSLHPGSPFFAK